jgi:hypothetical protein
MSSSTDASISIEVQTRAMFTRVLAAWASDLLRLRRLGLDVPGDRVGKRDLVTPRLAGGGEHWWHGGDVGTALSWRPAA